jgi:hypothetical protein
MSYLLLAGCSRPALARQDVPAAHAPAGPDPQFSQNATLIVSLENLSATYARRIDTTRSEVCRLRVALGRPACPPTVASPPLAHSGAETVGAQRQEIARLRSKVADQRRSLDALKGLQARLEAERARRSR